MKFGVFGTGEVGEMIGQRLIGLGHEVLLGSRSANNEKAAAWVKLVGEKGSQGTFDAAAKFGEVVFLSGNDATAKDLVRDVLKQFGWQHDEMMDLGDITTARGPEMFLALWVRMFGVTKNGNFNVKVMVAK